MPATPSQAKPVKVVLDCERTITYDNRAEFRMGSLDRPFTVGDLSNKRRSWAALVAWTWACLCDDDAAEFPTPESLAAAMQDPEVIRRVLGAFVETYTAATPPPSKNAAG